MEIQTKKLPLGGQGGLNIIVTRKHFLPNCTIGSLEVIYEDNPLCPIYLCDTLEPHAINWNKESKVKGKTAIPCGQYKVRYRFSKKFGQNMPFLENVPHFEGIMFHIGNYPKDTQGCILTGCNPAIKNGMVLPFLNNSRSFFTALNNLIYEADKNSKEVVVTIRELS